MPTWHVKRVVVRFLNLYIFDNISSVFRLEMT